MNEQKQFPGTGKTLAQLSYGGQRTRATAGVIKAQEAMKGVPPPMHGKEEEKKRQPIPGRGVKIGGGVEAKKGEWRCKVCKFKNDADESEACSMCKEPKQVMKEVAPIPMAPPPRAPVKEERKGKDLATTG